MAQWPYYPVFLKLDGEPVLLVGGGEVAARKLRLLLRAGARVELIADTLHEDVAEAVAVGGAVRCGVQFEVGTDLACYRLVIAASSDAALNARVAAAADAVRVPVNVVDDAQRSSFVTPAIIDRAPLLVAVSSGGAAPVLVRRLRERIEGMLPARYGHVAAFMQRQRARVRAVLGRTPRRVWEDFLDGSGVESLLSGDETAAMRALDVALQQTPAGGEVYLVGAGPGDPDLLSFRALRLMQQCDVVLYDALISQPILELVRRDAERVYVGKRRAKHTLPQEAINDELIRRARAGQRVLRLKGGDPFVFGRGGEEIDKLSEAGVVFQVVPGITAANGCAAYAGIPLTHRDYAQSCMFVTGHPRADGKLELNWDVLARRGQTVVIYMGLTALSQLCQRLIEYGLPADWPAAVVQNGTRPDQRVLTGTLEQLPTQAAALEGEGPSLVIVGEVVRLRDRLRWFDER